MLIYLSVALFHSCYLGQVASVHNRSARGMFTCPLRYHRRSLYCVGQVLWLFTWFIATGMSQSPSAGSEHHLHCAKGTVDILHTWP
jgi:hypothetical protein